MSGNTRTVLITGGAKRIGAHLARAFGSKGWHVAIHFGNSRREAEALADELPSAETVSCDLDDWEAGPAMVRELAERRADWRLLVNCAAVFEYDDATGLQPDTFEAAMQVNAGTPARMAQAFFAHARTPSGRRLIQVTDQKLRNPNPDFFSYTMSKHALAATIPMLSMARSRPQDRVYGLAPGAILASHDQTEDETEISHRMNLLRRKTSPDDIVRTALFLAEGPLASGETVYVDSGQHLVPQPRDVLFLART
ncbi:MAG: SDR family oxidoreductase [Pseudomonadota bacterium]|nr:SDR family oxidoreductase [Pseudomonadota bacterium]